MSDIFTPKDFEWYERQKLVAPERVPHPSEEDIARNFGNVKVQKWTLEGNMLIGETSSGKFAQPIPTNYICTGMDDNGSPKLRKIVTS
jgi:hypothetical protein